MSYWKQLVTGVKNIPVRLFDLIVKNISMKVESACVVTYVYMKNADTLRVTGFVVVTMMWALVVGFRYAEKLKNLTYSAKEGE